MTKKPRNRVKEGLTAVMIGKEGLPSSCRSEFVSCTCWSGQLMMAERGKTLRICGVRGAPLRPGKSGASPANGGPKTREHITVPFVPDTFSALPPEAAGKRFKGHPGTGAIDTPAQNFRRGYRSPGPKQVSTAVSQS